MANMQAYGLTGRKIRPNYVDVINSDVKYLPQKKALKDEQDYRNRSLALTEENMRLNEGLAKDQLDYRKGEDTKASVVGLGQLALETDRGFKKDKALTAMLEGGGGKATGGVEPAVMGDKSLGALGGEDFVPGKTDASFLSKEGLTNAEGWKQGASNWGPIIGSSLTGGTVGADLAAKAFGDNTATRVLGGAATSGLLSYLASGDPYTAAISFLGGGAVGGLW